MTREEQMLNGFTEMMRGFWNNQDLEVPSLETPFLHKEIYPLTIIADRYNGTYSGGKFLAFNMDFDEIPEDVIGDDVGCYSFFCHTDIVYGKGETPTEAYRDLLFKLGGKTESGDGE